jgi:DNA-binding FadR family transcriptional regulator
MAQLREGRPMTSGPDEIQPIALQRPSQLVAAELRQRILRGEWRDGATLPPASVLAQRLGISQHHLREALRLLEHDGLIRVEPGRNGGISLAIPDEEAVTRILEGILARYGTLMTDMSVARGVIDEAVAGLAAERATADDLAMLEAIVEREQTRGWGQTPCTEFHLSVARATHNQPLLTVVQATWPIGAGWGEKIPAKLDAIRREPSRGRETVQAHLDLVEAITARDSPRARDLMRQHHAAIFASYEPALRGLRVGRSAGEMASG